ncbi:UNVERIFIED_CONTAM: hypothetical protein HHA_452000 [Hammondia hammondi]|eukprot:XP_008884992.1 hypothetical protein HHA_452000 [Hammondia hammondi]
MGSQERNATELTAKCGQGSEEWRAFSGDTRRGKEAGEETEVRRQEGDQGDAKRQRHKEKTDSLRQPVGKKLMQITESIEREERRKMHTWPLADDRLPGEGDGKHSDAQTDNLQKRDGDRRQSHLQGWTGNEKTGMSSAGRDRHLRLLASFLSAERETAVAVDERRMHTCSHKRLDEVSWDLVLRETNEKKAGFRKRGQALPGRFLLLAVEAAKKREPTKGHSKIGVHKTWRDKAASSLYFASRLCVSCLGSPRGIVWRMQRHSQTRSQSFMEPGCTRLLNLLWDGREEGKEVKANKRSNKARSLRAAGRVNVSRELGGNDSRAVHGRAETRSAHARSWEDGKQLPLGLKEFGRKEQTRRSTARRHERAETVLRNTREDTESG